MRKLLLSMCAILLTSVFTGCTSHSWTQVTRNYIATYDEVFETVPKVAPKCEMKMTESDYEGGTMVLSSHRTVDKVLTGSLINMFAGDVVMLKVKRVEPTVTSVWIDSKAKGQIGPDFGRTDRNVTVLTKVLDQEWAVKEEESQQVGEKRE